MHTKKEVIKKAILFEIDQLFQNENIENNNRRHIKTDVFNDVLDFYVGAREQFKYKVLIKDINENDNDVIKNWLKENNIAYYYNGIIIGNITTLEQYYSFWFVNEEDASAFKLKWSR